VRIMILLLIGCPPQPVRGFFYLSSKLLSPIMR
jgi:hypothetical protein